MEPEAEALHRRIALHRNYLRAGVIGSLAITYLRQIAEDHEALERLLGPQCCCPAASLAAALP